eukprot:992513-Pleurochrysis_carterae.AAC.2
MPRHRLLACLDPRSLPVPVAAAFRRLSASKEAYSSADDASPFSSLSLSLLLALFEMSSPTRPPPPCLGWRTASSCTNRAC